uniref:Histidine kinase domain-containing protein n=1 Tax=Roseihalotalea indica TaxID=2867963 RepID=A0AA49GQZ2_9BACT|nr:hypothetical protein K4G66_09125 [Tunicatimonas sp. TK19036]
MESVYKKIVDTVPVFFFLWSQEKKETIFISEQFYDHHSKDYYVSEGSRHDLRQYIHPESQSAYDQFFLGLTEENDYHNEIELCASDNLPGIRWMKISTFPVINEGKEIESIAGHIRDITHTKEHSKFLQDQVESLDTVMFMLAHELSAPITNMMGLTDMLKNKAAQAGLATDLHLYDSIYNFGGEVLTIAHGLVSLLELQSQKDPLTFTEVSLKPLLGEIINNFYLKPNTKTITLSYTDIREDASVHLHSEKFGKAIEELLVFLVRCSKADGTISLLTPPAAHPNQLELRMVAPGANLAIPSIKQVLDRSSRLSMLDVKGRAMRGMLELVIAKEIVELHQGRLELLEDQPLGFAIKLPHHAESETKSEAPSTATTLKA